MAAVVVALGIYGITQKLLTPHEASTPPGLTRPQLEALATATAPEVGAALHAVGMSTTVATVRCDWLPNDYGHFRTTCLAGTTGNQAVLIELDFVLTPTSLRATPALITATFTPEQVTDAARAYFAAQQRFTRIQIDCGRTPKTLATVPVESCTATLDGQLYDVLAAIDPRGELTISGGYRRITLGG